MNIPIKLMDFFVWLDARRRHSELWQRRATTPDGKRHDLIGMFIVGYHLRTMENLLAAGKKFHALSEFRAALQNLFPVGVSSRHCIRRPPLPIASKLAPTRLGPQSVRRSASITDTSFKEEREPRSNQAAERVNAPL
jgi:hypothetical protein